MAVGTLLTVASIIASLLGKSKIARSQEQFQKEQQDFQEKERKRQRKDRKRQAIAKAIGSKRFFIGGVPTSVPKAPDVSGAQTLAGIGQAGAQIAPLLFPREGG